MVGRRDHRSAPPKAAAQGIATAGQHPGVRLPNCAARFVPTPAAKGVAAAGLGQGGKAEGDEGKQGGDEMCLYSQPGLAPVAASLSPAGS